MMKTKIDTSICPLFPSGSLHLHGDDAVAINTTVSRTVAAAKTKEINNGSHVLKEFFSFENPRVYVVKEFPDGEVVSVMAPLAPYTEGGFMVLAGNRRDIALGKTQTLYDLSEDAQQYYWFMLFSVLLGRRAHNLPGENISNKKTFFTENCIATVTSEAVRTSRSIGAVHAQVNTVNSEFLTPSAEEFDHLRREQRVAQMVGTQFTERLLEKLPEAPEFVDVHAQMAPPFGYRMTFNISDTELLQNTNFLQMFFKKHHMAYTQAAQEYMQKLKVSNQEKIIPQPSYRLYGYINEQNKFTVIISPEFLSHAGVMEAAGIRLERASIYTNHYSDEEITHMRGQVVSQVVQGLE